MVSLPLAMNDSSTSLTGAAMSKSPSAASCIAVRATDGFTAEYVWKQVSRVQSPRASDNTISPSRPRASCAAGSNPESTSRRARSSSASTAELSSLGIARCYERRC